MLQAPHPPNPSKTVTRSCCSFLSVLPLLSSQYCRKQVNCADRVLVVQFGGCSIRKRCLSLGSTDDSKPLAKEKGFLRLSVPEFSADYGCFSSA